MIEFPVTLSTLLEKGDFNKDSNRIRTPIFFPTRTELTKQWRALTRYPVNASKNGDLNRGCKSFLMEELKKKLTRMAKKTKRSWTYLRENGVDLPYLFLHPGFSIVASLAHTEEFFKKTNRSWTDVHEKKPSGFAVFVSSLRL